MPEFCVDSSVLVATFNAEPEAGKFEPLLFRRRWIIGWPTVLETRIWLIRNRPVRDLALLDRFLKDPLLDKVAFDGPLERLASDAFDRYGKGRHPARLNYGDCMSYAVAKQAGVPLLFKGGDFALTDILVHPASATP